MAVFSLSIVSCAIFTGKTHAGEIIEQSYEKGIKLKVETIAFKADQHKIQKCDDGYCFIDGEYFFGSDGDIPDSKLKSIIFEKDGKTTTLDVSSMYNPRVSKDNIKYMLTVEPYWGNFYKVTGHFSGGAAAYLAQWIVSVEGSVRIHLSDFESIFELTDKIKRRIK